MPAHLRQGAAGSAAAAVSATDVRARTTANAAFSKDVADKTAAANPGVQPVLAVPALPGAEPAGPGPSYEFNGSDAGTPGRGEGTESVLPDELPSSNPLESAAKELPKSKGREGDVLNPLYSERGGEETASAARSAAKEVLFTDEDVALPQEKQDSLTVQGIQSGNPLGFVQAARFLLAAEEAAKPEQGRREPASFRRLLNSVKSALASLGMEAPEAFAAVAQEALRSAASGKDGDGKLRLGVRAWGRVLETMGYEAVNAAGRPALGGILSTLARVAESRNDLKQEALRPEALELTANKKRDGRAWLLKVWGLPPGLSKGLDFSIVERKTVAPALVEEGASLRGAPMPMQGSWDAFRGTYRRARAGGRGAARASLEAFSIAATAGIRRGVGALRARLEDFWLALFPRDMSVGGLDPAVPERAPERALYSPAPAFAPAR